MQLLLQWRKRKRWQDDWLLHPDETRVELAQLLIMFAEG